jgi:hypothetical protein
MAGCSDSLEPSGFLKPVVNVVLFLFGGSLGEILFLPGGLLL